MINDYGTFKLRLTPNGFSNPKTICIIGPGVVINLATLIGEIQTIQQAGITLKDHLHQEGQIRSDDDIVFAARFVIGAD